MSMLRNSFKIFIFLLVAGFLFLTTAGSVLAQFDVFHKAMQEVGLEKDPAKDPLCWEAKVCQAALQQQFPGAQITQENWQSPGPNGRCGSDLGVCLPAGTTPLEIKIGQTAEAKDLGDYIKTIYIYLLSIGGIVAAVMLIKGGFEWMTLGGGESKKNAQATISNALIGLLLLSGSYVLLYTINPDLVNLKLPQVYMVRPAQLIDMAEGSPCWEKGPTNAACVGLGAPNEYTCHPIYQEGPLMGLVKSEIMLIMTSAVPIPGGSIIGAKVGGWGVSAAKNVASKYVGYFFKSPAGKLASMWGKYFPKLAAEGTQLSLEAVGLEVKKDASGLALRKFAQAIYETAKNGKADILKMVVGGPAVGAGAAVGSVIVSDEIYDLLYDNGKNGYPGICEKTLKLPEGMFCNALAKPSDCASGSCVEVVDWTGWTMNMKIGVCSPGGAGNPCNTPVDCGTEGGPFKCIYNECTDGSFGRTCEEYVDGKTNCQNGLQCIMTGSYKKKCMKESPGIEGQSCQAIAKPGEMGACWTGLKCLVSPKEPGAPLGVCTKQAIKSPCYKNNDCNVPDSENPTQTVVKCLESNFMDKPYKPGKCWFLYYNANPKTESTLAGKNVVEGEPYTSSDVGCTSQSDCPNSYCISGGIEEYQSCAGDSNE